MKVYYWNKNKYNVILSGQSGVLTDFSSRNGVKFTDGTRSVGSICYTLQTDNLITENKPAMTPWVDREAFWEQVEVCDNVVLLRSKTLALQGEYHFMEDRLHLEVEQTGDICSEVGINFPLNFMSKKGGEYLTQMLPSSPFEASDSKIQYWYLDSPGGQNLLIIATGAETWKLDYSEYVYGHFILNLKWLYQLDRVYGKTNPENKMKLDIFFPDSFLGALETLADFIERPVLFTEKYHVGQGESIEIHILGKADIVEVYQGENKLYDVSVRDQSAVVCFPEAGIYRCVPRDGTIRGMECVVGVIEDYATLFHKNLVKLEKPYHGDRGLCEGGVWAQAACLHQRLLGFDESVQKHVEMQFEDIFMKEKDRMVPMCTIPDMEIDGWPAYHVYKSLRIQGAFFALSLFIEAYRTYGIQKYLDYALHIMGTLEKYYILDNGEIILRKTLLGEVYVDYTTVTAPVIAVVDLARLLNELEDSRAKHYEQLAEKIADYLVKRGFCFPTEGGIDERTEPEMEDGSISCTALSVLYVCYWIHRKEEYIRFAGEVLKFHETWCVKTPDVRLNRSSLRWWENLWEGDQDGPAICGGHAWTLWRAEADFYYGLLAGDGDAFLNSYNAFGTNLIKMDQDGYSYACYQPDKIPGGGKKGILRNKIKYGYPKKPDQSLSKYLWVRIENTWWNTCVVLNQDDMPIALNAQIKSIENNTIFIKETVTPIKRIINLTDFKVEIN